MEGDELSRKTSLLKSMLAGLIALLCVWDARSVLAAPALVYDACGEATGIKGVWAAETLYDADFKVGIYLEAHGPSFDEILRGAASSAWLRHSCSDIHSHCVSIDAADLFGPGQPVAPRMEQSKSCTLSRPPVRLTPGVYSTAVSPTSQHIAVPIVPMFGMTLSDDRLARCINLALVIRCASHQLLPTRFPTPQGQVR
jgi:hypothetical protein